MAWCGTWFTTDIPHLGIFHLFRPTSSGAAWTTFSRPSCPSAEEAGVKLALHPDDPPVEVLRNSPRLVWKPELYQKLIDLNPSPANTLEYCVGTMAEMVDGDVYQSTGYYAGLGRIGYVHLRNIRGKVSVYKETFIDEGDVDVRRIIEILARQRYEGVIIPDHAPQLKCAAPWHAGMAFAMGYLRACIQAVSAPKSGPKR